MEQLKQLIQKMNAAGVPLPLIKIDGKASFTGTLTWISFNAALFGQCGKVAGFFGGVDVQGLMYLFGICIASHLGRKVMGDGKSVTISQDGKE